MPRHDEKSSHTHDPADEPIERYPFTRFRWRRRLLQLAGIGLGLVAYQGCNRSIASVELGEMGCTDVELHTEGLQTVGFTAVCEARYCTGSIEVGLTTTRRLQQWRCRTTSTGRLATDASPTTVRSDEVGRLRQPGERWNADYR